MISRTHFFSFFLFALLFFLDEFSFVMVSFTVSRTIAVYSQVSPVFVYMISLLLFSRQYMRLLLTLSETVVVSTMDSVYT